MKSVQFLKAVVLSSALGLAACVSNVPKAGISDSADPREEIVKLESSLSDARASSLDVLAPTDFEVAEMWRERARNDLGQSRSQERVINDIRNARNYLNRAMTVADSRRARAPAVFNARTAAVKAGAYELPETRAQFKQIDRDVKDDVDDLSTINASGLSELEARYLEVERQAMVTSLLSAPRAQIASAEREKAKRKASQVFKTALIDLKSAESAVSANVRNPAGYAVAVENSKSSASLLNDVMAVIRDERDGTIPENVALQMVLQSRKLKEMAGSLAESQDSARRGAVSANEEIERQHSALETMDHDLAAAQAINSVQSALENARTQFRPEDAEVSQQGANLVIRLKTLNFQSGSSDLPGRALPILAKVNGVAKMLKATELGIQGHTDSIGRESLNQALSKRRADAIAAYFKVNGLKSWMITAEGFGSSRPIASNKTKEGRAENRRVDVVIKPLANPTLEPVVPASQARH